MIKRGEIWWADLGDPRGSEPGYRRPVLVIQADAYNRSHLATVIVLSLTTNRRLADMPGNVDIQASESGLQAVSVVNVTQMATIDKSWLEERVGALSASRMDEVTFGLATVLDL